MASESPVQYCFQKNAEVLEALQSLVQHTVQVARSGDFDVQCLANIAYGAARSCRGKWMGALFMALARVAERSVGDFNEQDVGNTA